MRDAVHDANGAANQVFQDPAKGNARRAKAAQLHRQRVPQHRRRAPEGQEDLGRYAQTPVKSKRGAFKTPTLRDIGLTAPYFQTGRDKTLKEVVEHYTRGGDDHDNLDINDVPLELSDAEKHELVAFLQTLDGVPMQVTVPALPH